MALPYTRPRRPANSGNDDDSGDKEIETFIQSSREIAKDKEKLEQQTRLIQSLKQKLLASEKQLKAAEQSYSELAKRKNREQDIIKDESDHRNVQKEFNYRQQELDKRQQELDRRRQDLARQEQELGQHQKRFHETNKVSRKLYFRVCLLVLSTFGAVEKFKKKQCTRILSERTARGYDKETVTFTGLKSLQSELAIKEDGYSSNSDIEGVEESVRKYGTEAISHGQSQSLLNELAIQETKCSSNNEETMNNYAEFMIPHEDSSCSPSQTGEFNATDGTIHREDSSLRISQVKAAPHAATEDSSPDYAGNKPVYEITAGAGLVLFGKREWALIISWIQTWRTIICNWSAVGAFHHFAALGAVIQFIFWILCIYLIRVTQISSRKSEEALELWSLANGLTREYLLHHARLGDVD